MWKTYVYDGKNNSNHNMYVDAKGILALYNSKSVRPT